MIIMIIHSISNSNNSTNTEMISRQALRMYEEREKERLVSQRAGSSARPLLLLFVISYY